MASRENAGMDCGKVNPTARPGAIAGAMAAGNGPQQGFATGATRSSSDDKIDYEGHISPVVLRIFGEYMHEHRMQRDGQRRDSDNWQKGIPLENYAKSLIRHTQEFWLMWRGQQAINVDTGQPFVFRTVLCAILFNTMGLLFEMAKRNGGKMLKFGFLWPEERAGLGVFSGDHDNRTAAPKQPAPGVDALGHRHYKDSVAPCCKEPNLCGVGWCFLKDTDHPLHPNKKSDPRDEAALAPSVAEPETNKTFGQMIADANKVLFDKEREARIVEAQKRAQAMASGSGAGCANPVIKSINIDRATASAFAGFYMLPGEYTVQLIRRTS